MISKHNSIVICLIVLFCLSGNTDAKTKKLFEKLAQFKNKATELMQNNEQLRSMTCTVPASSFCRDIPDIITNITKQFDACCTQLQDKLAIIIPRITDITFCESPTPITQADIPFTATVSGAYCLVESVTVPAGMVGFTVNADRVEFDLNGFNITGGSTPGSIAIDGGSRENIIVKNGSIDGGTTTMQFFNCRDIQISDIAIRNMQVGLELSLCENFRLSNINCSQYSTAGFSFLNSTTCGSVSCCSAVENANNSAPVGFEISNSAGIVFSDCSYERNSGPGITGFEVFSGSSSIIFNNCRVNNNSGLGFGFLFNGATSCLCNECIVSNNPVGNPLVNESLDAFVINNSSTDIICTKCLALDNFGNMGMPSGNGFVLNSVLRCCLVDCVAKSNGIDGFSINNAVVSYLANNISIGNGTNGFFAGTGIISMGNYAEGNGTNWAISTNFAPRFTLSISTGAVTAVPPRTAPVTKWDNIDVIA